MPKPTAHAEPVERDVYRVRGDLEAQQTAGADAQREIDDLRRHRSEVLASSSVADIRKLDAAIGDAAIKLEIAAARTDALKGELETLYAAERAAAERPTQDEIRKLLDIVLTAHDWLLRQAAEHYGKDQVDYRLPSEFKSAFRAVGAMRRTEEVDTKRLFGAHIDDVNDVLRRRGRSPVSGVAVLAAIIAHGDIKWRMAGEGQPLEVGLSPYVGRECSDRWKDVLQGAPLLAPVPSRHARRHPSEQAPRPIVWQKNPVTGAMEQVAATHGGSL